MLTLTVDPFHSPRSTTLACLLAAVLIAGCADATLTPAPTSSLASTATATPSATSSTTPAATSNPTSSVEPGVLPPGSMAVTVSDRLRVRSQPRVSDDSAKYEPVLPTGTELLIIEGPVSDSGYDWYRVAPVSLTLSGGVTDGWVAAADHDGTPWIALGADPLAGLEFAKATLARADGTPADARRAATSINAFALELYRQLRADPDLADKGIVFSPASIALALAMARAGARGETAAEMDAVLHTDGWKELAGGLNALDQLLASHNATWTDDEQVSHALSLRIANAAFGQRGFTIEPAYLDVIAEAFSAQLGLVDYETDPGAAREAINAWVSRQTAKRIPELLKSPDVSPDTRLVLVNAVYLKANWLLEFDKEKTTGRAFTLPDGKEVQIPTMSLLGGQEVPYATGSGWKATELRYVGADRTAPLAMTLILPDDLAAFEQGLSSTKLSSIVSELGQQRALIGRTEDRPTDDPDMRCPAFAYEVELFMPRFGLDTRAELPKMLAAMGIREAFDRLAADFSGITSPTSLFISKVIHQANIDVDETGTEAAAATAIGMDVTGGCGPAQPGKTVTLRLDRPFLFVLRDVTSGAILFMGRVLDPSARS